LFHHKKFLNTPYNPVNRLNKPKKPDNILLLVDKLTADDKAENKERGKYQGVVFFILGGGRAFRSIRLVPAVCLQGRCGVFLRQPPPARIHISSNSAGMPLQSLPRSSI